MRDIVHDEQQSDRPKSRLPKGFRRRPRDFHHGLPKALMRTLCLLLTAALQAAGREPCVPPLMDPAAASGPLAGRALKRLAEVRTPVYTLVWINPAKAVVRFAGGGPSLISFERIFPANRESCPADTRVDVPDWLGGRIFLHVSPRAGARSLLGQGVAGIQTASRLVLFPREGDHPSTISFEIEGPGAVQCLITGLSTGTWEVWWNGGLVDPDLPTAPGGTLSFQAVPGGYFLRRR